MLINLIYSLLVFCGTQISSTTHPFEVFVGLISFNILHRMRLIPGQRSYVVLWCRTECHNIAKGVEAKFNYVLINLIYDIFVFCGTHISSTTHSFGVFLGLLSFNSLRRTGLT